MAPQIPITEPRQFVAGDTWKWDKTLADFPAGDGWQLSYSFRGETDLLVAWGVEVTSPSGEDGYEIRIDEAKTILPPGPYKLYGRLTDGTDVFTPIERKVTIVANPATVVGTKSFNQTIPDAIKATLSGGALTNAQKSVRIHGRSIDYYEPEQLEALKAQYEINVALEENPGARLESAGRFTNAK